MTRRRWSYVLTDTSVAAITILVLAPVVLVLLTGVKDTQDVIAHPLGLPTTWHWGNFTTAWREGHFGTYFGNSVKVVVPTVAGILVFSTLGAFAFARGKFRGRGVLFALFLLGLTVPLDILVVPLFFDMRSLGLLNSLWAVILPQIAIGIPFGILLLRSFMEDLPEEIFEAAQLDGCSSFRTLIHIVVPLTKPALITLLVFNFMWTWNQFLLPTVMIQSDDARTLPVGLNYFQGRYTTDIPLLMAGATIAFVPTLIVYMLFQRQFIRGITVGAVK